MAWAPHHCFPDSPGGEFLIPPCLVHAEHWGDPMAFPIPSSEETQELRGRRGLGFQTSLWGTPGAGTPEAPHTPRTQQQPLDALRSSFGALEDQNPGLPLPPALLCARVWIEPLSTGAGVPALRNKH